MAAACFFSPKHIINVERYISMTYVIIDMTYVIRSSRGRYVSPFSFHLFSFSFPSFSRARDDDSSKALCGMRY
jgi:hypothetical protein